MQFKQIYADTASKEMAHTPLCWAWGRGRGREVVSDSPDRYFMPYVPNKTPQPLTHPVIEMQKPERKIAVAKTIFLARKAVLENWRMAKMQTGTWMDPYVHVQDLGDPRSQDWTERKPGPGLDF